MATLTQEMKDMIATQQCFIGTVNADGTPNVAPKRSTRVLSDDSLIFTEGTVQLMQILKEVQKFLFPS
jgi:predicted pyridoxine 5'-phosphate oxidase superfamily flavin-nucleotide-binding protein